MSYEKFVTKEDFYALFSIMACGLYRIKREGRNYILCRLDNGEEVARSTSRLGLVRKYRTKMIIFKWKG